MGLILITIDEKQYRHELYCRIDPFGWLKPQPDPWKPQPLPWKEVLKSKWMEINPQPEPPGIEDMEVLATMGLLVEKLSPELRESLYKEINKTAQRILPDGIAVEFSPLASGKQDLQL